MIDLDSEQKLIQGEVRKFTLQEIAPIVQDIENNIGIPPEIFRRLTELGLLSPIVPVEFGGPGFNTTSLCIIIEELSKICGSIGFVVAVNNALLVYPLTKFGSKSGKSYLDKLSTGSIGSYGLCPADKDRIAGEKPLVISATDTMVLNGEYADFILLNLESIKGLFVFDKTANKLTLPRPYLLGLRSSGIAILNFENLEIAQESCLVDAGTYHEVVKEIKSLFNTCISAVCLGIAESALDSAIKYAKERKQFGRAICEFAMVQEMLAEMKVRIEAARNLVFDAAIRFDLKEEFGLASEIAALNATETAFYCGVKAVQVFGGYGYTKDYPVERYLRDAKTLQNIANVHGFLKTDIARQLL